MRGECHRLSAPRLPTQSGGVDRGGDVVVEVAGAAQRAVDPLDF
jgi:hypothetical protein